MQKIDFPISEDYIELIKLLKAIGLAQTGGHAKMIVDDGLVSRNGEIEKRKRAKLVSGDKLTIDNQIEIKIITT